MNDPQRAGSNTIVLNDGTSVTSLTIKPGDTLTLVSNGPSWFVQGGSQALAKSASFQTNSATPGYQRLPSGVIIQWGSATTSATGVSANFPVTFPTACGVVQLTIQTGGGAGIWASHLTPTTSAVYLQAWTATGTQVAALVEWMAIGY